MGGSVGIGTTSPNTELHVDGTGQFGDYLKIGTGVTAGYYQDSGNGAYRAIGTGGNRGYYFQSYAGASTTMYVGLTGAYAGNVGIGTTNPSQELEVNGTVLANDYRALYNIYLTSPDSWIFRSTGGTERVRVTSAGNVGIGTTSPNVRLELRREDSGDLFELNRPASTVSALYGGVASNHPYLYSNNGIFTLGVNNPDGGTGGEVSYITMRNGSTRYTTFEAGNVGIGITNPLQKLHVSGNVDIDNGGILLQQGYGINTGISGYDIWMPTTTRVGIQTAGAERLSILNNGNVGIGTTSPASQLHLYGASGATGEIRLESSNGKAFTIGSTGTSYGSANNLIIYDINASTERLRIDTNGKVGIGVTNPSRELVVAGNVGLSGSNTYIFGGDNEILAGQDGSGYYFATGNGQNLTKPVFIGDNNSYIRFQSGDAERMRITSSGEVGIGTSNPETNLHIWNSESGQTATNVAGLFIENGGNSNSYYVFQTATGVGKSFSITNAGNVGIGTTSPVGKLQIGGTSGNLLTVGTLTNSWNGEVAIGVTNGNGVIISKVNTANDTNRVLVFYRDDTNGASIFGYTPSGGSKDIGFQIRANASSYFNGGNVGIGTTSPSTKLDVNGVVTATGGNSTNWNTAYGWGDHSGQYLPINGGTVGGAVTINGALVVNGTITENSSLRVKENIITSDGHLEKINKLRPVKYNKINSDKTEIGLIAEEVEEVYPEFIQYDENGDPIGIHYSRLTASLIGAVKELTKEVEELKSKING